jgi:hypothetical protein
MRSLFLKASLSLILMMNLLTKEEKMKKGILDRVLEKAISRKLLVFGTATGLMMWDGLDSETWGMIAIVYIGGQAVVDTMKAYKFGVGE